jgi:hypothetical protein
MENPEREDALPAGTSATPAAPALDIEEERQAQAGWQAIPEYLAGFAPEGIPSLVAARELELVYPLLHALVRGSLRDFFVRIAALEALVEDGRSPLSTSEVGEVLYWLNDAVREPVVKTLRGSGWLEYQADAGYRITETGRFVAMVLSFLRARVREGSLVPTVEGIEYMLQLGGDPVRQVLLLRSQLEDLRAEMEAARSSHSEVLLRRAVSRLQHALDLSARIRAVLAHVPLEMTEARHVAHDVHELLSRLHGVGSELHAAITEVGRQYLKLVAGLTTTDIIATLMRLPVDELAGAGRAALRPMLPRLPVVVPELVAAAAEAYLARERAAPVEVQWTEPPVAEAPPETVALPAEVERLLDDLDRLAERGEEAALGEFVPHATAGESLLRASLLALLGESIAGEGVAARLGSAPLTITVEGDAYPAPAAAPLAAVTPGMIGPTSGSDTDG